MKKPNTTQNGHPIGGWTKKRRATQTAIENATRLAFQVVRDRASGNFGPFHTDDEHAVYHAVLRALRQNEIDRTA